jgi:hypothetical protein
MEASRKTNVAWLIGLFLVLEVISACAATNYPTWWSNVIDTNAPNDFAPATQGQLKWIATNAFVEMESNLSGGAGPYVRELVAGFSASNNFYALNLGQLKCTAASFYDRLIAVGYTNSYPWTMNTTLDDSDFAVANLGQLKNVFGFDLAADSDSDGLPDWWEQYYGLDPFDDGSVDPANGPDGDPDGDGFTNLEEYQFGMNPITAAVTDTNGAVSLVIYTPLE